MNLRDVGRARVLRALHDAPRLSRPDLVSRTGLARATVAAIVADLVAAGLVREDDAVGSAVPRTGRPPQTLTIVDSAAYALGVDIGHLHVRAVLSNASGTLRWDRKVVVDADLASAETLDVAAELVIEALASCGVARDQVIGVGAGIASPVYREKDGLAAEGIMPGWVGMHPASELSIRTGLSTVLINDANAGAIGERLYGAGRHVDDMIYIRLSEGIGAGIVSAGRLLLGTAGLAGEIGHLPIVADGLICRCGNRGCLETLATPSAVARLLSDSWHITVTPDMLIDLVRSGDRGARLAIEDAGQAIGRALSMMVTLVNPELIVVGGDLARCGQPLLEPIRRAVMRHAMPSTATNLRIVFGELHDDAEVRGAAGMILNQLPEALTDRAGLRGALFGPVTRDA
jgi:predicted NBD/HSP70 family sugar kinase